MPNEVKLLPCPLCGDKDDFNPSVSTTYKYANPGTASTDLVESGHMIECDKCGCCGPIAPVEEEAVRLWNTRPTTVVTDEVVERVEQVETGLRVAMVASCNCDHEANISPKPEAHDLTCRYRVLYVAADLLADIRLASMPTVVTGEQPQDLGEVRVWSTRPMSGGVMLESDVRPLRDIVADEMSKVLASTDRASPYALADVALAVPMIAAALSYLSLASRTPTPSSAQPGDA